MMPLGLHFWSVALRKPDGRWRIWHRKRALNQFKRKFTLRRNRSQHGRSRPPFVELWDGEQFHRALCHVPPIRPPEVLSLSDSRAETLSFLAGLRDRLSIRLVDGRPVRKVWYRKPRQKGGPIRLSGYTDFSTIDRIGTSAAVIIASEYDRARLVMGQVPPAVDIHKWSDGAFRTLFELGFFDLLGMTGEPETRYAHTESGDTLTMRMISGENGDELRTVSEAIRDLTGFINAAGPVPPNMLTNLNSAIGEAMINVRRHAYEEPFDPSHAYVPKWWFTAEANRKTRKITAVLFDQGATIPGTLPYRHRSWSKVLVEKLAKMRQSAGIESPGQEIEADADAIAYAMQEGTTQTDEPGRGKGLPQMKRLIKTFGAGHLMVLSRGGMYLYASDAGSYMETLSTPVAGTLVEWEIEVPRL